MDEKALRRDLNVVMNALNDAAIFLINRDRMNAVLHQDNVRWSPLTKKVERAEEVAARIWGAFIKVDDLGNDDEDEA